ncbi:STAS-like domain-containing protein [Thauera sp. WH-2]|uniref:STAS-like domain-containing protein n=1 Tax=Thauera sp. WH-2 TaxID=3401574 RepID=UPI003AB0B819
MVKIEVVRISPRCYTNEDGDKIHQHIYPLLKKGELVELSFKGIDVIPSSFANTALISLLEHFDFEYLKTHLFFKETSRQINDMIRTRFSFEVSRRANQKDSSE